jgi:hypothetical protein
MVKLEDSSRVDGEIWQRMEQFGRLNKAKFKMGRLGPVEPVLSNLATAIAKSATI